jgi:hypothetical protein
MLLTSSLEAINAAERDLVRKDVLAARPRREVETKEDMIIVG